MTWLHRILLAFILFATISPSSYGALVTLFNPGTDDRIKTITGLNVNGESYDVTFHHGTAFSALPPPQITFTDLVAAVTAAESVSDGVAGIPASAVRTIAAIIPFAVTPTDEVSSIVLNFRQTTSTYTRFVTYETAIPFIEVPDQSVAYVTFSRSVEPVPEPTTLAIAATFSLGTVLLRRRRKTLPASSK
jgi:hypothetical protein